MVLLFGTASETCLEIADRAPYAFCVRCRCASGCHTCEALGVARRARSCGVRDTCGSKGNPQKSSMRRMTPSGSAPSASYCAPAFESSSASKNTPVRVRYAASNWRASTRCAPSSASVWREVKRRLGFLPLLRVGGLKVGMGSVVTSFAPSPLARRSLRG